MRKSVFSRNYETFLTQLRKARKRARLTQEQVGKRLGITQSEVSKCERGERRIDIVELRAWCKALRVSFTDFTAEFDRRVS